MSAVRMNMMDFRLTENDICGFAEEAYLSPWEEYFRDGRVECFEFRMGFSLPAFWAVNLPIS